jgi:Transposase DDE domain group 1
LLRELADRVGLTRALGWRQAGGYRRHPDAAVLRDLAVMLADGGDCLSDLAALRDQPELFGPVASTPTAWRVLDRVALDVDGLARLRAARATPAPAPGCRRRPRCRAAGHRRRCDLGAGTQRHKEGAAGTYKHTFGFAPLLAYLDRGAAPGEPLAGILRPGNAAPGTASDLVELVDLALAQLPTAATATQPVLVRSDSAGGSSKLAWHLRDRRVEFSLGMQIDAHVREAILAQPEHVWTPAVDTD